MTARIVEVREGVLKKNDLLARGLRTRFREAGVTVVNLVSSPGSGKTALLERTLTELAGRLRVAALVGDLATDNDARRLAASGAPVRQISTGTVCHLDAEMIERALSPDGACPESGVDGATAGDAASGDPIDLAGLDLLFIENVGNLVCPSSYDLGEDLRAVLFAVTEGEDKPLKYPTIYNSADLVVLTKIDLAEAVGFDRETAYRSLEGVRPGIEVIETSARTGEGMEAWLARLEALRSDRGAPAGRESAAAPAPEA